MPGVVVVSERPSIQALVTAVTDGMSIQRAGRLAAVLGEITHHTACVVVDIEQLSASQALTVAHVITDRSPAAAVIGLSTLASIAKCGDGVGALGAFTDILLLDREDPVPFLRAHLLDESRRGARCAALRSALAAMPQQLGAFATLLVHRSATIRTHVDLACQLGVSRATLQRQVLRESGMRLGELDGWCRVLVAVAMLERTRLTLGDIATAVGIRDRRTLRRLCATNTALLPSQIRARGALEVCQTRLIADLQRHSEGRGVPRY